MRENDLVLPVVSHVFFRSELPSGALRAHVSIFHDLIYILEGSVTYLVNDTPYTLHSGWSGYVPRGCLKQAVMNSDTMLAFSCLFHIKGEHTPTRLPLATITGCPAPPAIADLFKSLYRHWTDKNHGHELRASACLLMIMAELQYGAKESPPSRYWSPHIKKAVKYIETHCQRPLKTADVAEHCRLHPVYLASLFREHTGKSVKDYVNQIRIHKAREFLDSGEYIIAEAAYQSGFSDALYFSKVFKKYTGLSPVEYVRTRVRQRSP